MEFPVVTEHFIDLQFLYYLPIYASWFSISSIVVIFINMTHAVNLDKYLNLLSKYLPTLRFLFYVLFDIASCIPWILSKYVVSRNGKETLLSANFAKDLVMTLN